MRTIALAVALAATPIAPASAADTLAPQFQPLAFLAGSCWRASFPSGQMTDTHCFSPILNGHFLRDRHIVTRAPNPYFGETIYRWDAAAGRIRFDYYASDGSHGAGTAGVTPTGLAFTEDHQDSGSGTAMQIRSSWTREGDDAYVTLTETREGEGWRTLFRLRFTRIAERPAD
jgi:hypothetical protein